MRKTDFDSKLIVYRSRKIFLGVCVLVMTAIFSSVIFRNGKDYPWYILGLPFTGMGLLFLFIPMTEEWQYKPWQGKPRRIEQQER